VGEIMKRMRSRGHTLLLVEQNLALALSVADEVHIIASGRIVFSGTPQELTALPDVLDEHLGVSGTKSLTDVGAHA
jgi:branched-chain amino acid transport system ATP-binding protein